MSTERDSNIAQADPQQPIATTTGTAGHPSGRLRNPRLGVSDMLRLIYRPQVGAMVGALVVFAFFAVAAGGTFVSRAGTASWADVSGELGIVAIPVALLMIAGELDLSVGSVVGASSMVVPVWTGYYHQPIAWGIVLALLLGVLVGLFNGIVTTRTRVPSLIVTLGSSLALAGAALAFTKLLTGSTSVSMSVPSLADRLFASDWGQFDVSILWWLGLAAVAAWVLNQTRYGNWILAVGGDVETARAAGVATNRVKISLFVLASLGATLTGIIQSIEYTGSQVNNGQAFMFNSIIAVVIGGVLLTGGYGSIFGVVFGTLTFGIVNQGIYYTGWDSDWAQVILGGLLLVAVLTNNTFRRAALSRWTQAAERLGKRASA